jgi:hypothetical protein
MEDDFGNLHGLIIDTLADSLSGSLDLDSVNAEFEPVNKSTKIARKNVVFSESPLKKP